MNRDGQREYAQHMMALQEQEELNEWHQMVDRVNQSAIPDMKPSDMDITETKRR